MKFRNYIVASLIFLSALSFSQPVFSNIDSLLVKNVNALNLKDSSYYAGILNYTVIFKGKKTITKEDSLVVLKPFYEAFSDVIESLKELSVSPDFTVTYSGYECLFKKMDLSKENGKARLKVSLILNDSFVVRMLFDILVDNGQYSIDSPLLDMFIEEKE